MNVTELTSRKRVLVDKIKIISNVNQKNPIKYKLNKSGSDSFIKYIFPVFKFPNDKLVYLHAQVRICFPNQLAAGDSCQVSHSHAS